jgi:BioD-like phosphotransacetylase family protein
VADLKLAGIIINKVKNMADFSDIYGRIIEKLNVRILGILPYQDDLARFSVNYLSQYLLARVVSGETYLNRRVKHFFVGAGSVDTVYADAQCQKENKLVITSGDRSDMLLASFEDKCTAAVVVTDNILPPPNIIARAEQNKIPVLLVPFGVYETARQIEALTPLITSNDTEQIQTLEKMVKEHVDLDLLMSNNR